jgi:hypothetical protein
MTNNTTNLADFGMREISMARDLLDAWLVNGLPADFEFDCVTVMLNPMSGMVFLTNAEFQVAVISDGKLVSFYSSPYEGHEGTLAELIDMFDADTWNGEDIEWLEDLSGEVLV